MAVMLSDRVFRIRGEIGSVVWGTDSSGLDEAHKSSTRARDGSVYWSEKRDAGPVESSAVHRRRGDAVCAGRSALALPADRSRFRRPSR